MSTGHPVRSLRNRMTREYLRLEQEGAGFEELEKLGLGALRRAVMEGDVVNGTVMAGQIAGMVKQEQTCQEMLEEIMAQAEKLLSQPPVLAAGVGSSSLTGRTPAPTAWSESWFKRGYRI